MIATCHSTIHGPTRHLRVLHLIDSLAAGGKERQLVELLKGLRAEPDLSCELIILSSDIHYEEFSSLGIVAHQLPRKSRYDVSVLPRMHSVLRQFRPTIVHSWNAMCSVYGAPLAKLAGAKFVNAYVQAAPAKPTYSGRDFYWGKLTIPISDVVVANSQAGIPAYGVPRRKAICIRNGIDHNRFATLAPAEEIRRSLGIATRYVIGMVAAFTEWKDHDTFFEAALNVLSVRADVTFVAIGDGPSRDKYCARFAAHPRIRLPGKIAGVENVVNIFDIGVLVSPQGEGIANAIMEYMALGKPVIATDCPGNRELVVDGETGFLVPNRDPQALARAILRVLGDPSLARSMGEAGRRRIDEHFSLERMAAEYAALYRRLAGP